MFSLYDDIGVVFLWQTWDEQFSAPHLHGCSLGLYSNSVNTESDLVWNILLSKSVAMLSVLFTCRDQQISFWNVLFILRFTKSQFQQKKKRNKSLAREVKIHITFHLNSQAMSSYIFTPSHTSVYFQKRFHLMNHSCCSFLHLWENKTKEQTPLD